MTDALLEAVRRGDRRALSRALSAVEAGARLEGLPPPERIVGITGPPGAGKSTLIGALATEARRRGQSVGVVAVDPSSPITGGAILGDRVRMQQHIDDPDVFVRSMAARGHLGGLATASAEAAALLNAAGFDRVFVETVGVGQSEVAVMNLADVVVLVVGPGWGDDVQADKAGVVEIADLFVVNKGDRPGAAEVVRALRDPAGAAERPILVTTATDGDGVDELLDEIDRLLDG